MRFKSELMEMQFNKFREFIEEKEHVEFKNFKHPYIQKVENYKYEIYQEARERLNLIDKQTWKEGNIGKGKILKNVISAIEIKGNNLVQWDNRYGESGKQHKFLIDAEKSKKNLENYEEVFFHLYKRQNDKQVFNAFLNYTKDYRLISYFFFIKKKGDDAYMQKDRYLPIVPTTFDKIFEKLGVENYKAYGNCTFENYLEFISIVKEVKEYLSVKLYELVTILDAHSFLWILGNEMEKEKTQVKKSATLNHQV